MLLLSEVSSCDCGNATLSTQVDGATVRPVEMLMYVLNSLAEGQPETLLHGQGLICYIMTDRSSHMSDLGHTIEAQALCMAVKPTGEGAGR
jgi:hypothetical protein